MTIRNAYLDAAAQAVTLLAAPEVRAAWDGPSALAELTVGGLAGHLGYQIFSVTPVLAEQGDAPEAPIPLLEHYARARWVSAPLDDVVNAGIRTKGEAFAAEGALALRERARTELAEQRVGLPRLPPERSTVFLPQTGWALSLDDFLVTRMLELAVHMDDLAVSVGIAAPPLPAAALDPVLALLTRLSVRRHGQPGPLRALARAERLPGAINAL
ncbi:hypothetical protein GCM10009665_38110 [Kitasatospora nipponensis]|uniref:Mycothiol-dependent maleylpyruvate isomerase metal-binding domain-containing protein n=2 Tax=Kitasatospora nipponensis TaxID=258049 RepID=A0ABN1WAX5_9ACTN